MTIFLPLHLSVSAVSLYARCPLAWKLRYVDGLVTPTTAPQAWGIAFHKALEALHKGQDAEMTWLSAWNAAAANMAAAGVSFGPGKLHGLELLGLYRERGMADVEGQPERMFELPFPGGNIPVPLVGFIDLHAPSVREYWDWKTTGGAWWTQPKVDLEPQKEAYGWAYQQINRHRAERARWCVFSTKKPTLDVYETVPSPDGFRLFERQAESAWLGMKAGAYDGCGEKNCTSCTPPVAKDTVAGAPAFVWESAS